MEHFRKTTLASAALKAIHCFRYVDYTFVVWLDKAKGFKNSYPKSKNKKSSSNIPYPNKKIFLPYIEGATDTISWILAKKIIKTTFLPTKKVVQVLNSSKGSLSPINVS